MANRKKEVYKVKPMTEGKRNIIQGLLQEYDIEPLKDIQEAQKTGGNHHLLLTCTSMCCYKYSKGWKLI